MGWTTNYSVTTPDQYIQGFINYSKLSDSKYEILDYKKTNGKSKAWFLYQDKETKQKFIVLYLFEKHEGNWSYKDIDESMGPFHYECPMSLIKKASEPLNDISKRWRLNVRDYHANKRNRTV